MFWMGHDMGFHLVQMPMGTGMIAGMRMIVVGIGLACYGLLPRTPQVATARHLAYTAAEDAPADRRALAPDDRAQRGPG